MNTTRKHHRLGALLAMALAATASAGEIEKYYTVEDIPAPPGVVPECGGIGVLPDGRLVAAFHHGEVAIFDRKSGQWSIFAEGLHDPMGVLVVSERELLVCQRPELTRLVDTDGDGKADVYENLCDRWGLSGNYHEFASGPVRDRDGNLWVSLGNGSAGGSRHEVRGEYRATGTGGKGHFSAVPYRGWIVRISPSGELTPIAGGVRQPNGIGIDAEGRVLVTDNQGDWVGTSKLFHVLPGKFFGHAPGLVWKEGYENIPPYQRDVLELDRLRTEGAVLFPHAIMANSPGQPLVDSTGGKFGPFAGQVFVTEYNIPRIMRVMLETVAGQTQGAVTTFFDGPPLRTANHRLAFGPDGSLWCAQSERKAGWPGAAGIQRIMWNGKTPLDISAMRLGNKGFAFEFTRPVNAASISDATRWKARRYYYQYHESYGSPQVDVHEVKIGAIGVSQDGRRVSFDVDTLLPGYIYEVTLNGVKAEDGDPLVNTMICYTVNVLHDGSRAPTPRPEPTGETLGSGKDKPVGAAKKK